MATQAYRDWVRAGRPFRRPPWLSELKALARVHGVAFAGDLGSDDQRHLQNNFPQDHCPFSFTEWPVQISEYVINAIDLGNGPWAYRLIDAARAGRAPWLKYANVDFQQYNVENNWVPVPSSDGPHVHISGRTDHTWTGLNGFNPFIIQAPPPIPQEDDVKFYYSPGRGWYRVGSSFQPIVSQDKANVTAEVWGNAVVKNDAFHDALKATYAPEDVREPI